MFAVLVGIFAGCASDETSGVTEPATLGPSSICPEEQTDGACVGLVSCTYVDGRCDPGVASHTQHQCHCNSGAWDCSTVEVECGAGGEGNAGGGGAGGGSGGGGGTEAGGGSGTGGLGGGNAGTGGAGG